MSSLTTARSARAAAPDTAPAQTVSATRPMAAQVRLDYIDWLRILAGALLPPPDPEMARLRRSAPAWRRRASDGVGESVPAAPLPGRRGEPPP
jgi:hypothetical protein